MGPHNKGEVSFFILAATAVVLSEHLPRSGIRTPDLSALSPKVLSKRPSRWSEILLARYDPLESNSKPIQGLYISPTLLHVTTLYSMQYIGI